jgi:hypothetical protein
MMILKSAANQTPLPQTVWLSMIVLRSLASDEIPQQTKQRKVSVELGATIPQAHTRIQKMTWRNWAAVSILHQQGPLSNGSDWYQRLGRYKIYIFNETIENLPRFPI